MHVELYRLKDPAKETIFENCVADVNIPVGGGIHITGTGRDKRSPECQQSLFRWFTVPQSETYVQGWKNHRLYV